MEPNDITALFASDPEQGVKTDSSIFDKTFLTPTNERNKPKTIKREDLTTKNAVKYLLEGRLRKKVCRYCLNVASPLSELDQVLQIGGSGVLYKITIRDMVASFHPFKVADDPNFPNKICNKCLNRTISSYLFTQQCERSERALRNCFEDMFHKLEKLDSLEPQKKRGRHKLHPNYNILYTDHEKVIDYAEPIMNFYNASSELLHNDEKNIFNDFECLKCWQVLPNLASLKNHETLHPKSMYYHCRDCGKSFKRKNLLKKHILKTHDVPTDQKTDFRCLKCGVISDDYNTHLQHIEKHKFQMVLEHLVERNMDKLCAVCLEKHQPLTDLDKTVCLHGGYPEIMGDQSLYSILGSTVPDKSSYKYQELLVPIQAKVTRILKVKSSDIQNRIQEKAKYNFKFTSPTIIAIDEINFDDTHFYLFSSPCNIENEDMGNKSAFRATNSLITKGSTAAHIPDNLGKNNNGTLVKEIMTGLANEHIHISAEFANNSLLTTTDTDIDKNKFIDEEMKKIETQKRNGNIFFTFSKPEYDCFTEKTNVKSKISAIATIASKVRKPEKPCNICWIFKKPVCNKCLNDDNNKAIKNMDIIKSGNNNSQCSYCWVFKNSDGCDNCMKQNEFAEVDSGTKIRKEPEKFEECISKKDSATIKRKLEDFTDDKPKRRKWECQICLTANTDREQCICCDAQGFLNKKFNVKLSYNKDFYKHFNVINNERHLPLPLTPNVNKGLTEVNVTDHETRKSVSLYPEETKIADVIEPSMRQMDDVDPMTQRKENEEMDIVQEDSSYFNTVKLVFNPYTFLNFPPIQDSEMRDSSTGNGNLTSFKFHIGAVMPEDKKSGRKIKKPLRRSASYFHK